MGTPQASYREAAERTPAVARLKVGERFLEGNPTPLSTRLLVANETLSIQEDGGSALALREEFVSAAFHRYAAPLETPGDFTARLILPSGDSLLHMIFVPDFDVVPKDYLVWLPASALEEARVELCVHLVPPLLHLARAALKAASH